MKTSTRLISTLLACALAVSACGDGGDTGAAIDRLVGEGMPEDVAECIIDEVNERDVDLSEVVDGTPLGTAEVRVAFGPCLTDEALIGFLGVENIDQARAVLASRLSSDGSMTNQQAFCLIDRVEADGYSLVDVGGFTAGQPGVEDVVASLESARLACLDE